MLRIHRRRCPRNTASGTCLAQKAAYEIMPSLVGSEMCIRDRLEMDLAELEPQDAAELLESVGVQETGMNQLARVGFSTLGLQTFLTAGPKETRAWTIHRGWTAPQ